jgi:pSer/pThr/pTyr-binding forkhead associated (FHA) protein
MILIGRAASGVGVRPDLDCGTDAGVSGRHAQLVTDGGRWWLEDLDTTNGTFVGPVDQPLPTEPLATGARVEVDDDDRIYLGGWTRIVLRRLPDRTR